MYRFLAIATVAASVALPADAGLSSAEKRMTATVEADFERSCDDVLAAITKATDLKTKVRFGHPWFGPLDAFGWAAMAGTHMGIHRAQIQSIMAGLRQ